jgi:hypothetical protein
MDQAVRDLGKVDVVFHVTVDGVKRGEMRVSRGGIDWWPRNSKSIKHTWSWERLAGALEEGPRRKV